MNNAASIPKVEIFRSDALPNTIDIRLNNEGHTAASVIVERLDTISEFSAYRIAHPTDKHVMIRLQSPENPIDIFRKCIKSIIIDINDVITQIENKV